MIFSRLFFLFFFSIFLFSCKPIATEEQSLQYESCKKKLLGNKEAFIAQGLTSEKKDSLAMFLKDIESSNLEELISKFEVDPENVNLLVYSVCEKADRISQGSSIEETLLKADSMIKFLDSIEKADSLRMQIR